MKTVFILCLSLILSRPVLQGQVKSDCSVMIPALQGYYDGDCRNGFAHGKGTARGTDTYTGNFKNGYPHGKGTYKWASGGIYEGEWEMGKREGKGSFSGSMGGSDTVMDGIWKNDLYEGPKPQSPKIIQKYNVMSTTFTRTGDGNRIAISFYQNGINNNIEELDIITDSGTENQAGKITNFWDIQFPFYCKVTYISWNSLKTVQYNCILEFEITQPGSWDLKIGN